MYTDTTGGCSQYFYKWDLQLEGEVPAGHTGWVGGRGIYNIILSCWRFYFLLVLM